MQMSNTLVNKGTTESNSVQRKARRKTKNGIQFEIELDAVIINLPVFHIFSCKLFRAFADSSIREIPKRGITGKRTLHPLYYCMTLLGEGKHQTKPYFFNHGVYPR